MRWEDVKDLAEGASGFPAVELYQVGDAYFAVDGHHRISVARSLGAPSIEAHVLEFLTPVPLGADASPEDVLQKEGLADFLETTGLVPSSPDEFLGDFAGRTEADLYLFTARHLHDLRQRWGDDVKPGRAVEHLRLKTRLQAKKRPSVRSRARKQLEEPGEG